ncbi:hypothetical protein [Massilia sp. YIM B04103]|uniref:hypothetical protein n=1 Tax=Massilia sp. YIM B04103 TaxID=2963106 RepID=UPI00210B85CF|nr:hypothetical protein [Massilia sp. YIM B04103]
MHQKTVQFLEDLRATDWFCNVGRGEYLATDSDILAVGSWDDAIALSSSELHEDALREAMNEITVSLHRNFPSEYMHWNEKVREIKPQLAELVKVKLGESVRLGRAPAVLMSEPCLSDLLGASMAIEYSDFFDSLYFRKLVDSYLRGHFPCGWEGEVSEDFAEGFKTGKMYVY